MMGLRLIFVAALSASFVILLVHCAPTFLTSANDDARVAAAAAAAAAEKPLVRTKRAEEILYGNHQNAPRVKKSDPAAATSDDGSSTKNDNNDVTKDDLKPASTVTDETEKNIDSEQSASTGTEDENSSKSELSHNLENIPAELSDADYPRYEDQDGLADAEALRKKRSIKTAMMTAENMVDSSSSSSSQRSSLVSRPVRAKRDLDYEDLRQLFTDSREGPYDELEEREEPDERLYEMAPQQDDDEEEDGRDEEEQEEPGVVEEVPLAVALPYEYEPRYEAPSEKEELLRELVERKVEEDAREKLLDYLLAAAIASEAEPVDEAETDADVDDDQGIIDAAVPGRPDYEDESAQDVIGAGPRIALKRNEFYPYSYEPYGGRWGAMVPGTKRSANEYERLYRLAEALNAAEDDYDEQNWR